MTAMGADGMKQAAALCLSKARYFAAELEWRGWIWVKPGREAMSSLILGLYFMVQDPKG